MNFQALKPLDTVEECVKRITGFDIETYGEHNKFLCATLSIPSGDKTFYKKQEVLQFLQRRMFNNSWVSATNLMFDFFGLVQNTEEEKYFRLIMRGGRLLMAWSYQNDDGTLTLKRKKNRLIFLDTMNYLPASVEQLGKIIGIPKLKSPTFLGQKPKTPEEWEELVTYNQRDALVSRKFVEFLQDGFLKKNCKLRTTIASTSLDYWRRNCQPKTLVQPDERHTKEMYHGYYGGRTEVFKRGLVKDLNYYDFNSLYPSVMRNAYPDPNSHHFTKIGGMRTIEDFEGMSEVTVESPNRYYPLLPYRSEKILFPAGKFKGWYCHNEIRQALKHGYKIRTVHKTHYYTKTFYPFKTFAETLYEERKALKAKGDPMQLLMKLLMNSLYGKFGQNNSLNEDVIHADQVTIDMLSKNHTRFGNYFIFGGLNDKIPLFVHPIIASYTTAYARIKMHKAMLICKPYYVDTDSLLTPNELSTSDGLGKLKLEYRIDKGWLVKPKLYYFKGTDDKGESVEVFRAKGIMQGLRSKGKYELFRDILNTKPIDYNHFVKFKQSVRSKDTGKWGKLTVNQVIPMSKGLSLEDDKRVWPRLFSRTEVQSSTPITL